jgi:cell division protein FtsL
MAGELDLTFLTVAARRAHVVPALDTQSLISIGRKEMRRIARRGKAITYIFLSVKLMVVAYFIFEGTTMLYGNSENIDLVAHINCVYSSDEYSIKSIL